MVQDGKDDLVHVLPQPEVDLLLFLKGFHELEGTRKRGQRPGRGPGCEQSQCPNKTSLGARAPVSGVTPGQGESCRGTGHTPREACITGPLGGAQMCVIVLLKAENAWPEAFIIRSDTQCLKTLRLPAISSCHPQSCRCPSQVDSCCVHGLRLCTQARGWCRAHVGTPQGQGPALGCVSG